MVGDMSTMTTGHLVEFDSMEEVGDSFRPDKRNFLSPLIITGSRNLVAGLDFPDNVEITICMCGGGGAGCDRRFGGAGGGSGNVRGVRKYLKGTVINAVVGLGSVNTDGLLSTVTGGTTLFDGLVAVGGFDGTNKAGGSGVNGGGAGGGRNSSGGNRPVDLCYPATFGGIYNIVDTPTSGGGAGGFGNGGTILNLSENNTGAGGVGERTDGYGKNGKIILSWRNY